MADYPGSIYDPRTKENAIGVTYDSTKAKVAFAEDITKLDAEVIAIEQELNDAKALLNLYDPLMLPWDDTGLVLYLPFDENTGEVAGDKSFYGNDGAFKGAGEPAWSEGHRNAGVDFDGTDDYVKVLSDASLQFDGDFSFSVWVKAVSEDDYDKIVRSDGATCRMYLYGRASTETLTIVVKDNNSHQAVSVVSGIFDNSWHHLVVVAEGTQLKTYKDGEKLDEDDGGFDTGFTFGDWYLGADSETHFFLKGKLDEVRIYNRALSAEEVKMHYLRS